MMSIVFTIRTFRLEACTAWVIGGPQAEWVSVRVDAVSGGERNAGCIAPETIQLIKFAFLVQENVTHHIYVIEYYPLTVFISFAVPYGLLDLFHAVYDSVGGGSHLNVCGRRSNNKEFCNRAKIS